MGMYNEVHKKCPECGRPATIQISQVTLGFGGFDLDNPSALAELLTESELVLLHEYVKDETFYCQDYHGDDEWLGKGCGKGFKLNTKDASARLSLAKKLFGGS